MGPAEPGSEASGGPPGCDEHCNESSCPPGSTGAEEERGNLPSPEFSAGPLETRQEKEERRRSLEAPLPIPLPLGKGGPPSPNSTALHDYGVARDSVRETGPFRAKEGLDSDSPLSGGHLCYKSR